jgi:hypothetical protein
LLQSLEVRMPSGPDSPTTNVFEHTLPYRVLMEEIKVRRPEVVPEPATLEDELNAADRAREAVARARDALIQAARELSAATRQSTDRRKELSPRQRNLLQAQLEGKNVSDGRALRAAQGAERERQQQDDKYQKALADYRAAIHDAVLREQPLKKRLHVAELNALCFSGGGIRSASFGLGVLSQLARYTHSNSNERNKTGIVKQVDYVSTVSGGGYIGSWFTGWIKRNPRGLDGVIDEIADTPATSADPEPAPVRHLRDYTSYLAPRTGAFSSDSWTLVAIVLRNLLLNWTILVPAFAAVVLLPVLGSDVMTWCVVHWVGSRGPLYAAVFFALLALVYISWKLPGNYKVQPDHTTFKWAGAPLFASAWCLSLNYLTDPTRLDDKFRYLWGLAAAAHVGLIIGRVVATFAVGGGHRRYTHFFRYLFLQALVSIGSSAATAGFLWALYVYIAPWLISADPEGLRLYVALSVPLVWITFMLATVLLNGLSAPFDAEEDREWWARAGAYVMRGTLLWIVANFLVLYSTDIVNALRHFLGFTAGSVSLPAITVAVGGLASWIGFSPATSAGMGKVDTARLGKIRAFLAQRDLLVPALGGLFFLLLGIGLAALNQAIASALSGIGDLRGHMAIVLIEMGLLAAMAVLFNLFINVNTFSLHAMYRSRLLRAYLGASNETRKPNPFINFDPDDNFPMHEAPHSADAPLHVINMALNLVATKKLAWQQRKAESFTVTPLHSGSFRVGYQPSGDYAGTRDGITIGTAMAISGAAASPNMGYHSSPILTLAMTFFNARLGWWLPNPGPAGRLVWKRSGPLFSLGPLLNEGLGQTTDDKPWVYASDGGHFENLGLYEMVLRRCKRIIVVDGSADPEFKMEDLGNAVRKINIDLGVPIDFVTDFHIKKGTDSANRHCAVAEIKYGCVDRFSGTDGKEHEAESGWLVYIKASMNGREPADVLQYAATHKDFPHESTANQFFNESQFASYVRLGSDIVSEIVTGKFGANPPVPLDLAEFFEAARTHAGPTPPEPPSPTEASKGASSGK